MVIDLQAQAAAYAYHFVSTGRGSADAEHGIAFLEQAGGNRMEHLAKGSIANFS